MIRKEKSSVALFLATHPELLRYDRERKYYAILCAGSCGNEVSTRRRWVEQKRRILCKHCCSTEQMAHFNHARLEPFRGLYNYVHRNATKRDLSFDLAFYEFLQFTQITSCIYCKAPVSWVEFGSVCSNIDRKDNRRGYSKSNCVVCCFECNRVKAGVYSFEEMLVIGAALKLLKRRIGTSSHPKLRK